MQPLLGRGLFPEVPPQDWRNQQQYCPKNVRNRQTFWKVHKHLCLSHHHPFTKSTPSHLHFVIKLTAGERGEIAKQGSSEEKGQIRRFLYKSGRKHLRCSDRSTTCYSIAYGNNSSMANTSTNRANKKNNSVSKKRKIINNNGKLNPCFLNLLMWPHTPEAPL
jgi:hypothetical protein